MDFTALTAAMDTAIAAIKVGPGFLKWGYNKVIGWFR
jgi:hypothetical protein